MKFGHFDDEAREYVITTPATPLPWINYLGTEGFFSLISNTSGGYSLSPVTVTMHCRLIPTENITISKMVTPSGIPAPCHPKHQ